MGHVSEEDVIDVLLATDGRATHRHQRIQFKRSQSPQALNVFKQGTARQIQPCGKIGARKSCPDNRS
jgi:hypothetical protein